jgi:hypothetical protein
MLLKDKKICFALKKFQKSEKPKTMKSILRCICLRQAAGHYVRRPATATFYQPR